MDKQDHKKKVLKETEFFTGYREANRYKSLEIIGKGSYGVVFAAIDTHTGEKVAIKKISNNSEHLSDAIRILREIKLLRLLRHPDIVEIKQIMLPPSRWEFRDIYVVFELMESDLHEVIKANNDLTHEHHKFFLYQMLRALKYMHTANVYHRDLKPKNVLANANCKLKICDLGLARVAFNDTPATTFWTDYVATRWYRAPELCGSFFSKYTPAIDIWSIGCIFAEVLIGKPLFPGKSVVHQLELITDLLGTPSADKISGVRNDKARKYLMDMRKKCRVSFCEKFPNSDPLALKLLQRLLAFDPKDRPSAEEALADPYFKGLAKIEREPSCQPISKVEFEFERRRVTKEDIRELIFREILEYHPELQKDYLAGNSGPNFLYPSGIGSITKQFVYLEEDVGKSRPVIPPERKHVSLPRSTVNWSTVPPKTQLSISGFDKQRTTTEGSKELRVQYDNPGNQVKVSPPRMSINAKMGRVVGPVLPYENIRYTSTSDDHRRHAHDTILPPQSTSSFLGKNQENRRTDSEMEKNKQSVHCMPLNSTNSLHNNIEIKAQSQQNTPAKLIHGMSIDMNAKPCYQVGEKAGTVSCQSDIDSELLSAQCQFVAAGAVVIAAAAAHREVTAVHLGLA